MIQAGIGKVEVVEFVPERQSLMMAGDPDGRINRGLDVDRKISWTFLAALKVGSRIKIFQPVCLSCKQVSICG